MIRVLLVAFLCACVHANLTIEYQEVKEGQSPHCIDKEGSIRSLGETWEDKGRCTRTRCLASVDRRAILQIHGCRKVQASADCEVVAPPSKELPFPDCCPQLSCKTR